MTTIIITSILIGCILAPLGCVVLWKRYVYFGDGLAHASLLAGVISVMLEVSIIYIGIINTLVFAYLVFKIKNKSDNNASIGFISSVMISISLVLSYKYPGGFNISSILFGDIIAATNDDLLALFIILIAVIVFFLIYYRSLIMMVLSRDIAASRDIAVKKVEFLFLIILSLSILYTVKIVGALLVTSIILIPAMIARIISSSPLRMIFLAVFFALVMNIIGMVLSFYLDLPFSPLIILSGAVVYCIIIITTKI